MTNIRSNTQHLFGSLSETTIIILQMCVENIVLCSEVCGFRVAQGAQITRTGVGLVGIVATAGIRDQLFRSGCWRCRGWRRGHSWPVMHIGFGWIPWPGHGFGFARRSVLALYPPGRHKTARMIRRQFRNIFCRLVIVSRGRHCFRVGVFCQIVATVILRSVLAPRCFRSPLFVAIWGAKYRLLWQGNTVIEYILWDANESGGRGLGGSGGPLPDEAANTLSLAETQSL